MSTLETYRKLDLVYRRRKQIAEAKMYALEKRVRSKKAEIAQMRFDTEKKREENARSLLEIVGHVETSIHFATISSAIRAKQLRDADDLRLMRFNTLRQEEYLDELQEDKKAQHIQTSLAARKSAKFDDLIDQEMRLDENRKEIADEEEVLDAANKIGGANA